MDSMAGKRWQSPSNVEYPRRRFEHFLWALLVLFVSLALGVGAVGFFYAKHEKTSRRRAAAEILGQGLADISARVAGWVESAKMRALKAAEDAGGAATLLESVSSGRVSEVEGRLAAVADAGHFDWAALFDGSGRLSAAGFVRGGLPEIRATPPEHALAAMAAGRTYAVWLPASDGSGELAVQIWCPARSEPEGPTGPAGAIVFGLLAQRRGFPDMACRDVLGAEVEARLCAAAEKGIAMWPAGGMLSRFENAGRMMMESPEGSAQFQIRESDGKVRTFITAWRQALGAEWTVAGSVPADRLEAPLLQTGLVVGSILLVFILSGVLAVLVLAWLRNTEVLERRLAAERERRALADRLEHLMLAATDAIIVSDRDGAIIEANRRAAEMYGRPREDLRRMRADDLFAPESRAEWRARLAECGEGEKGAVFEALHMRADGAAFPVEVSSTRITAGGEQCCFLIIRDLSERKEKEAELLRMSALHAALSRVNQAVVRSRTPMDLFAGAANALAEAGGFSDVWIAASDSGRAPAVQVAAGASARAAQPGADARGLCGLASEAWTAGRPVVSRDLAEDRRVEACAWVRRQSPVRSCAVFPVFVRGRVEGLLAAGSSEKDYFDERKAEMVGIVASNIGVALERMAAERELGRSLEQLRAANALLGAVCGVNHLITHEKDVRIILERACAALAATPVFAAACALVFGSRDRVVIEKYAAGERKLVENLFQGRKPEEADWVGLAADSQDPVEIRAAEPGDAPGCRAYAVAMRAAGRVYGVLIVWLKPSALHEEPLSYFQTVAGDLAFAMYGAQIERERRRAEERSVRESDETRRRNEELERFRRLALGRELRMIEIKRQVNELSRRLGEQPPYPGVLRPDEQGTGGSGNEGKDKNSGC